MAIIFDQDLDNILVDGIFNIAELGDGILDFTFDLSGIAGLEDGDELDINGQLFTISAADILAGSLSIAYDLSSETDGPLSLAWTITDATDGTTVLDFGSASTNIDTTAPAAPTITVSDMSVTDGETANFTIAVEYDELMDESGLNDPSVNLSFLPAGFALVGGAWSNDGSVSTYTVTYTVADVDDEVADIDIIVSGGTDAAGNPAAGTTEFAAFSVDANAPTAPGVSLDMDTSDGAAGNNTDGVTSNGLVNVLGLEASATWMYSTDGGGTFIAGTGTSFMLPAIDGDYDIVVRQTDAAGNVSPDSAPVTYTLDTNADVGGDLTVSFDEMQISATESGAISVTIAGLDANTEGTLVISTSGGATTQNVAVSGNGTISGIDISALEDGSLTASLMVTDDAGNMATAAQGNSAVLDTMAPTLMSAAFDDVLISDADSTVTLTLTFSEAMDTLTNPTIGLNTADLAAVGAGSWNLAGTEFSITYNITDNNDDLSDITVDVSNASDTAGNNLTAVIGASSGTSIDMLNPVDETGAVSIDENPDGLPVSTGSANGDVVATFDNSDGVTYAIDTNPGNAFAIVGNELRVADETALDFEDFNGPLVIAITATDDAGNTTSFNYTVTLNDLNDAPQIDASQPGLMGGLMERTDVATPGDTTENDPAGFETSGTFSYTDDDAQNDSAEIHDITIAPTSSVHSNGGTGFIGIFTAGIETQAVNDPNGVGEGEILWQFGQLTAAEMLIVDALGAGETITQQFTVTITEQNGGLSSTELVTITITGTNDVPTITAAIDSATITELPDMNASPAEGSQLSETGTITFDDVDTTDMHTASVNAVVEDGAGNAITPVGTFILGNSGTGNVDQAADSVTWTFSISDAAIDYLAAGEQIVQVYTVEISDGNGGMVPQEVTVTIEGTNDVPTLTVVKNTGSVTETDSGNLTDSGSFTLADVDVTDEVVIDSVAIDAANTVGERNGLTDADLLTFLTTSGSLSNAQTSGTLSWSFDSLSETFDYLGAGESLVIVYDITVDDGNGGMATESVTVTINGTNDQPVISAATGEDEADLDEVAATTAGVAILMANGTLSLSDDDLTDTHVITEVLNTVSWEDGLGNVIANPLPSGLMTTLANSSTFTAALDAADASEIDWAFELADADIDFLAEGEELIITYNITADDQEGFTSALQDEDSASVPQTVTITITGTNDVPVITTTSGTDVEQTLYEVGEMAPNDPTANSQPAITANGNLAFTDADATNTFTASVSVMIDPASTAPNAGHSNSDYANLFTLTDEDTSDSDIDVSVANGIDWAFSAAENTFDYLTMGESVILVYTVVVTDNDGGTAQQTVTLTIEGRNDQPIITVADPNADTEGNSLVIVDGISDGTATAADTVTIDLLNDTVDGTPGGTPITDILEVDESDVQSIDMVSIAVAAGSATVETDSSPTGVSNSDIVNLFTIGANGVISYDKNDPVFDALEAGESIFVDVTYRVNSGPAGDFTDSVMRTVTVEIQGQNDAPFFTTPASGFEALDIIEFDDLSADEVAATDHVRTLFVNFDDVELNDMHQVDIQAASGAGSAPLGQYVGTFSGGITSDVATGPGTGTIKFEFEVSDSVIDNLAEGETLLQYYDVLVTDVNDPSSFSVRQILITIVGTNDAPIITGVEDGSGNALTATDLALFEDSGVDVTGASSMQNISGTIEFDDVDVNSLAAADDSNADTHLVTAEVSSVSIGGVAQTGYTGPTGALTFDTTAANNSLAVGNSVGFDFDINDADFDFLAAGEVFSITYTVTVDDQRSVDNTDTVDVTFTITGTNDAPVITAGGSVSVAETADASDIDASITVNFTDADLSDVGHVSTVVAASVTAGTPNGMTTAQLLSLITVDSTTKNAGSTSGNVVLDFSAASTEFDYLSATESVTITYILEVNDGDGGVTNETFDIVVTGTNDAPVIATGVSAAATETTNTNAVATAVTVNFTDVDLSDVGHTASVTAGSVTSGVDDGLTGVTLTDLISVASTTKTNGSSSGSVALNFSAASTVFDYLAASETVTITYTLEVDDGDGGVSTETFDIVVTGTNDVPVITAGASETVAETVDTSDIETSVTVNFTDVDLNDVGHTAAVTAASAATTAPSGLTGLAGVNLVNLISVDTITKNAGSSSGTVVLDFLAASTVFDYLAVGESVTITYTLQVDDLDGGVTTETFDIVVTGTNDAPTIVAGSTTATGAIKEASEAPLPGDPVEGDTLTDSGVITFSDVDLSDTHIAAVTGATDVTLSSGVTLPTGITEFGTFTLGDAVTQLTDNVDQANDTVVWDFSVNDADIDFLNEGETITQVYTVEIDDQNGGKVEQEITIVITGTNDAPTISSEGFTVNDGAGAVNASMANADLDNTFTQDALSGLTYADDETYTVNGQLDAMDSDTTAVLEYAIGDGTGTGVLTMVLSDGGVNYGTLTVNAVTGSYTFVGDAAALNALDASDVVTLSTDIQVTDDNGASATDGLTITLNGVNDAPIAIDDEIGAIENQVIDFNVVLDNSGNLNADFDAEGHALTVVNVTDSDDSGAPGSNGAMPDTYTGQSASVGALAGTIVTDWGATVRVEQNGDVRYNMTSGSGAFDALGAGDTAVDTFTYTIEDTGGLQSTATVSVTITGVNDQIFANSDTITAVENVADNPADNEDQAGNLLNNDTDVDIGDTKAITTVVAGANSSVTGVTGGFDVDLGQGVIIHVLTDGSYTVEIPETLAVTDVLTGSFSYTVADSGNLQSTTTVNFTVTGANDPVIVNTAVNATMTEDDGLQSVDLLSGTSDVDAADVLSVVAPPTLVPGGDTDYNNGVSFNAATNSFDIDPNAYNDLAVGESITLIYDYQVTDGNGSTVNQTATVVINGANDAPTVSSVDPVTQVEGNTAVSDVQTVDIFADLVTATDPDASEIPALDNTSVSFASAAGADTALLTNNLDGTFSYDLADFDYLAAGESAVYEISFNVVSGADTVAQTVSLTITGENDAPVVTAIATTASEDGPSIIVTPVFTDVDVSDTHTFTFDNTGTMGLVTANGDGTFTYDPNGAFEYLAAGASTIDTFTYTVDDGNGGVVSQTVTVTITGDNDAPILTADVNAAADDGVTVSGNVLTNDSDIDAGDSLSVMLTGGVASEVLVGTYGTLTLNADGTYDYVVTDESIDDGFTGTDVFNIDVTDGIDISTSTLTINITGTNDAPDVTADTNAATDDGAAATGNVLANDSDVDAADTLVVSNAGTYTGTYGILTLNGDGSYSYVVTDETLADGFTGAESFNVNVTDGTATVSSTLDITVTGSNDAPVVTADVNAATDDGVVVSGNVLMNDSDIDAGDSLSVMLTGGAASEVLVGTYGTLTLNADGTYDYVVTDESIDDGFTGTDVFNIDVTDGIDISTSTLTINITGTNDAPDVTADVDAATDDGVAVTGNVLTNDSDVDASDTLTVSNAGTFVGTYGTLTLNGDGSYSYIVTDDTLSSTFTGTESFNVNVTDGTETVISTLEFAISGSNDAPVAVAISGATNEDGPSNAITLTAVFTDVDAGDSHTFSADSVSAEGVAIVNNNDGTFTYDPGTTFDYLSEGQTATDTFTYTVDDGNGGTSTATATITITGQNDAPVAADVTATVVEDGPFITVMADFVDPDLADTFTFTFDDSSTIGSVTSLGNGNFSYDPNGQFESLGVGETAMDSFTYTVMDSEGVSSTATVFVTITGQNDAPQVTAGVRADVNDDDAAFVMDLLDGAFDPDGDTLSITNLTLVSGDDSGVVINGMTLEVDPTAYDALNVGDVETITYSYEILDGNGGSVTQIATIEIDGINDAAVISGDISGTSVEDAGAISGQLTHTDVDNDDNVFQAAAATLTYGSYTVDAAGLWVYTLDDTNPAVDALNVGDSLTETFDVLAEDGTIQTVTITIDGANDAAIISGDVSGTATEDAGGPVSAAGQLTHTDVDNDNNVFLSDGATLTYGSYTVDAAGAWEYVLDDNNAAVDALNVGDSLTEIFDVLTEDGTMQTVTITIDGTNDAALVSGDVSGTSVEDAGAISGQLTHTDVDNDDNVFQAAAATLTYGSYTVDAAGLWVYTLDDTNPAVDALNVGDSLTETFDVLAEDGTVQTVTITIDGANDAALVSGDVTATIVEDAGGSVSGQLMNTDVDNNDNAFQAATAVATTYGTYSVDAFGAWSYTLDDNNLAVEALNVGDALTDTFDVLAEDGTIQTVTITIDGANDAAVISGTTTGSVDENSAASATGTLTAADVDNDDDTFQANAATAAYGAFTVDAMGNWTYTVDDTNADVNALNDGETLTDSFDVLSQDGTVQTITITINGANDSIVGTPNVDTLTGGDGIDVLFGLESDDVLIGNGDDDILEGGAGADSLDGGDGNDTASYTTSDTRVTVNLESGLATGGHATGDTLTSIENLTGSDFNDTLIGDANDNVIEGGAGADTITGGAGTNTLIGGAGSDRFIAGVGVDHFDGGIGFDTVDYRGSTAGVILTMATIGTGGDAAGDTYVSIERLYGTDFNDTINGSAGNEFLYGEGGNDTINGGAGIDRIYGGDGNDIQRGQEGNDTLYGSAGADQLNGGIGIDVANYTQSTSRVELNLATGGTVGDAAGDTYFGIEIVFATSFDDIITGNVGTNDLRGLGGDDELNGEAGNDRLYGGQGADVLNGGDGVDAAYYTTAQEGVTLDLALGGTAGEAAGDTFSSIEWVFGSAFDDDITGDALANNLYGNAGNDILNGDDGNDRLQGGDGDDTINGGDGVDTIYGQAGNDTLSGGAGNDFFFGSDGGDSIDGGDDFDTVSYLASSSAIITDLGGVGSGGDATGDSYVSIERLLATNFDDIVQGGSGDETIQGLGGNDTLGGGAGSDSLFGGAGVDTFLYDTSADGADVISDFRGGSLGSEVIVLTDNNPDFDSFAEVQAAATQVGNNVIIDFGGGNTLTLVNYNLTHLDASAFQFGTAQKSLDGDTFAQSDSFDFGVSSNAAAALGMDLTSLSDAESNSLLALAEVDPEYAQLLQGMWEDSNATEVADFADMIDGLI